MPTWRRASSRLFCKTVLDREAGVLLPEVPEASERADFGTRSFNGIKVSLSISSETDMIETSSSSRSCTSPSLSNCKVKKHQNENYEKGSEGYFKVILIFQYKNCELVIYIPTVSLAVVLPRTMCCFRNPHVFTISSSRVVLLVCPDPLFFSLFNIFPSRVRLFSYNFLHWSPTLKTRKTINRLFVWWSLTLKIKNKNI